jgi:hypothetical protein
MQVISRCTGLLRSWSSLHRTENRNLFMQVFKRLEDTVREFITQHWVTA